MRATFFGSQVAWYENDGSESFATNVLVTTADGAACVAAADVDGDGDVDALSCWENADRVVWHENDGEESFAAKTVAAGIQRPVDLAVADLDGDGDVDVVAAAYGDDAANWYASERRSCLLVLLLGTSRAWHIRMPTPQESVKTIPIRPSSGPRPQVRVRLFQHAAADVPAVVSAFVCTVRRAFDAALRVSDVDAVQPAKLVSYGVADRASYFYAFELSHDRAFGGAQ